MANGNGKSKLDLQLNVPTKIKLLQDTPATGTSQFGKWYLYSVMCDETEMSFFAPEPVQQFIETNQLKKDDEIQITKSITKNGKTNVVDFKVELLTKQEPKPVNGNGKPDDIKIMRECFITAINLQKELGSVVDVNKVGLSLYISKTKNGNYQF
jgi:hypothetical protein